MKYFIGVLVVAAFPNISIYGQTNQFDEAVHKMLFNVMTHQADSPVNSFVKKYIPILAVQKGEWAIDEQFYSLEDSVPDLLTIHSLVFNRHPHFDFTFSEGQIDFLTRERNGRVVGLRNIKVWFIFNSEKDGEIAFEQLIAIFGRVGNRNGIVESQGNKISQSYNVQSNATFDSVEIVLMKDNLDHEPCKILFTVDNRKQRKPI